MSSFDSAFKRIITFEGGYVCDPLDEGGETKFGICKRQYPHLDIKKLSMEEAKEIYYRDYWLRFGVAKLPEAIRVKYFDMCVNCGNVQATKILQRACRACTEWTRDDGILGEHTMYIVNRSNKEALLASIKSELAGFYRYLTGIKPSNKRFLEGWLNRAYS